VVDGQDGRVRRFTIADCRLQTKARARSIGNRQLAIENPGIPGG